MFRTLVCADMTPETTVIDLLEGGHTDSQVALRVVGHAPEVSLVIPARGRGSVFSDDVDCLAPDITFGAQTCEALESFLRVQAGSGQNLTIPIFENRQWTTLSVMADETAWPDLGFGFFIGCAGGPKRIADHDGRSPHLLRRALMLARMTGA